VATAAMNSDVNAIPHDVNALGINLYTTGNPVQNTAQGNATFDPQPTIMMNNQSSKPASAKPVYFDGTAFYWDGTATRTVDIDHATFVIETTAKTTDTNGNPVAGTGGKVKATTGAADIAAGKTNPGTVGGAVPAATHAYAEGATKVGALSTAAGKTSQAIGWGVQSNPAPLPSVTVKVGAATVGTVTNAGRLDATAAVIAAGSGRTDFIVTLSVAAAPSGNPTGLCRVYGGIQLRTIVSSLNAPI
jgi:hypothetical protein